MNDTIHLSRQFDEDLERLRTLVLQMGGLVESQMSGIIKGYLENNQPTILTVLNSDHEINNLEKTIDDDCIHIIAKRQPTASDLRLIMSISKMVTDIERSGDEIKKMAKSVRRIQERDFMSGIATPDIKHLANSAAYQLRHALDTFARLDPAEARKVIADDEKLDDEFRSVMRQLITYMMEDARTITTSLDIITMARAIERVGDHAKNIAEQVIYIVEGRDVRHTREGEDA